MSQRTRWRVFCIAGWMSGAVAAVGVAFLATAFIQERRAAAEFKSRMTELRETAKKDASAAAQLDEAYKQQTDQTLHDERVRTTVAWSVVGLSAVFLLCAKWLVANRAARPYVPPEVRLKIDSERDRRPAAGPPSSRDEPGPRPTAQLVSLGLPQAHVDVAPVDRIVERVGADREAAIPLLQAIQAHYRYLPQAALRRVCELSAVTPAQIAALSTFYAHFRHHAVGEHIVKVCHGTACHVAGARQLSDELRRRLNIAADRNTDPDKRFTIEEVACLGCCSLAPVLMIDQTTCGRLTPATAYEALEETNRARKKAGRHDDPASERPDIVPGAADPKHAVNGDRGVQIRIGFSSCGIAAGGEPVRAALERAAADAGQPNVVKVVGCNGMCHVEPLVEVVEPDGSRTTYGHVTPAVAREIFRRHARPRAWLPRMTRSVAGVMTPMFGRSGVARPLIREGNGPPHVAPCEGDGAFLKSQTRIVLENCGEIDPCSIDDYIARDGYRALESCLKSQKPDDVIAMIRDSGLRGRGGAGFPTGRKWDLARGQPDPVRYVICNGDEGDPGAFMDRLVLEADPHRVVEGLAIAAYAVGAQQAYFYIRSEYPLAVQHIRAAITTATERGYLGERVFGTDFDLRVEVREGAGAFVCGEETALMQSIEGRRGTPRPRPPFPVQQGLRGHPTVINNVETLACVPWIVRSGPQRFASLGTAASKGTKVFALAGKIKRGGLIEVPMGVTIRQIVERIGGGIREGRTFKAVQIGGPSGGCIPARLADTPIDYEELRKIGGIMGSGGLVVLDERDCMVDIARFFLRFTQNESCGKCTFCRVGTKRMLEILERICDGRGRVEDLATLEELADRVGRTSLCGLGQTAPNPVLTTLRYFRAEYEAHVLEKRCPAGRCPALIRFVVNERCTGCTLCAQVCPVAAIAYKPYERHFVADDICTRCGMCETACPENAIDIV